MLEQNIRVVARPLGEQSHLLFVGRPEVAEEIHHCPYAVYRGSSIIEHSRVHAGGKPPEQSADPVVDSQQMRAISSN